MRKLPITLSIFSFIIVSLILIFLFSFYKRNHVRDIEIIWRNYSIEECQGSLKLIFQKKQNGKPEYMEFELIPNKTINLKSVSGKLYGYVNSLNAQYKINEFNNLIEIFLFDYTDFQCIDDKHYVVNKIDDVVAYEMELYDENEHKMFVVLSLDNYFEIDEIKTEAEIMKNIRGVNKMIEYCKTTGKDLAFYDSYIDIYEKGRNGIIVKSQLTNDNVILMSMF